MMVLVAMAGGRRGDDGPTEVVLLLLPVYCFAVIIAALLCHFCNIGVMV